VGLEMRRRWDTLRDDLTCAVCGPLNGMPEENWVAEFPNGPPAHVNCRCSTSLTMDDADTLRQEAVAGQTAREKLLREQVAGEKPGAEVPAIVGPTAKETRDNLEDMGRANIKEIAPLREEQRELEREMRIAHRHLDDLPLGTEGREEWNQRAVELFDQHHESLLKSNAMERNQRQRMREQLYVNKPAQFKDTEYMTLRLTPKGKEDMRLGVTEFRKLVGTGTVDDASVTISIDKGSGRASAEWDGKQINLTTSSGTKTTIHELGHWLEFNDSEVQAKALAFYDARTPGEKAEWLGDDYDEREVTRRDKFLDPYMGKDYQRRSTEIVSMGMEYYWDNPAHFARQDPEYFDFIFDLLRGR